MTEPVQWPESLKVEVAERRCVVVLGAGASAACTNQDGTRRPATWVEFLRGGVPYVAGEENQKEALQLIERERYLDAAQIVHDGMPAADFSKYLRDELEKPRFKASKIHDYILQLDPKIVITTNYDDIYERHCQQGQAVEGYNVCRYYESHAVDDLRSDRRLILKAHGCISDPNRVILTRKQYFEARRQYSSFYEVLDAIVLTNTLLFIGCSMDSDPDVQLLLENTNLSAPSRHSHYAVVPEKWHPSVEKVIAETYNVQFLKYPSGQHDRVADGLQRLLDEVNQHRVIPK